VAEDSGRINNGEGSASQEPDKLTSPDRPIQQTLEGILYEELMQENEETGSILERLLGPRPDAPRPNIPRKHKAGPLDKALGLPPLPVDLPNKDALPGSLRQQGLDEPVTIPEVSEGSNNKPSQLSSPQIPPLPDREKASKEAGSNNVPTNSASHSAVGIKGPSPVLEAEEVKKKAIKKTKAKKRKNPSLESLDKKRRNLPCGENGRFA
jgi:hypothetical protein